MHWNTLYIKGKTGFKPVVLVKLKGVILHGSSQPDHDVLMVWTNGNESLRSLKLLIGARTIFRYRLHFFTDLNRHLETKAITDTQFFSARERELLQEMRARSKRLRRQAAV